MSPEDKAFVLGIFAALLMSAVIISCCLVWAVANQHIERAIESLFSR